jgi:P-type conjugative transfer protein TrbJ
MIGSVKWRFAAVAALLLGAFPAHAQFSGLCATANGPCASLPEQLIEAGKQLEQLAQEVATAQNTLNFYQRLVANTVALPQDIYRDISGEVQAIQNLGQQASLSSGNLASMLSSLGATGYPVTDLEMRLTAERKAVAQAMKIAGQSIDSANQTAASQSSQLTTLEGQSSSATLLQAVQTGNQVASATGQLVAAQQAALTNAMQAQLTAQATAADKEAATETVVKAQDRAAIQSACQGVTASGVAMSLTWCNSN